MDLDGRVAIVTGGGKGIGRATAEVLAETGAHVLVATRGRDAGAAAVEGIRAAGGTAELTAVEMGTHDASRAVVDCALALWGRLDIVVHNAAYIPYGLVEDTPDAEWARALDVGPSTAFWLLKDALPHLRASPAGRMICVSTLAARYQMSRCMVAYGMSKGALETFVRGAALELAAEGITVNAVAPGGTMSDAVKERMTPEAIAGLAASLPAKRLAECDEIAQVIRFLASDAARFVTGQTVIVDGGQSLGLDIMLDE